MAARVSKVGLNAADLKNSELYGILLRARGEGAAYPDTEIMRKLYAAEDFYERNLRMKFQSTRVFSSPQLRATALDPAVRVTDFDRTTDIDDAAYDYEVGMFDNSRWSQVRLSHKPVVDVTNCFFWYPGTAVGASYKIPFDWRRVDYHAGVVEIVPSSGANIMLLSVNAYVLSSIASGRSIPQSIFFDYTTGLGTDLLQAQHQDLIEGVRLLALLMLFGVLIAIRTQGQTGGSLSLDGLSHSRSWGGKYGAYSGPIELAVQNEAMIRENWADHEQGPIVEFA